MDDIDRKIIGVLRGNARATSKEISQFTGVRPSTVHARIQKLITQGTIRRFTLELDDSKVGKDFVGFIFLTTRENLPPSTFNHPFIHEVFGITGEYDIMLKVKCKDVNEFNAFLLDLRKNKMIVKTLSEVATIKIKEVL